MSGDGVREDVAQVTDQAGYVSLRRLARYSGLSVSTLRGCLTDPVCPLPCYRFPGKIFVRLSDYDAWALRYRADGRSGAQVSLTAIVDDVMAGL
jgi:lambda repressor-like predicted transcriptional regulator